MNNLKRRRPYGRDDDDDLIGSAVQDSPLPTFDQSRTSLAPQDQYIVQQAAAILEVPVTTLLNINRQPSTRHILEQAASTLKVPLPALIELGRISHQRRQKRPRQNSEIPMPSPYLKDASIKEDRESSVTLVEQNAGNRGSRRTLSTMLGSQNWTLGIDQSSIVNAFRSLPFCPPCSDYETPSEYQAVPTTSSYGFVGPRTYQVEVTSPVAGQPPSFATSVNLEPEQPHLFQAEDTGMAYMASYPPLQPDRHVVPQPTPRREDMVYPGNSPNSRYFKSETIDHGLPVPALQNSPQMTDSADRNAAYIGEMVAIGSSTSVVRQASVSIGSSHYGLPQGYSISSAVDAGHNAQLERQPGAANLEMVFPNQRAPPAKRGPFKDHVQRQQTAHTRKIGSCIRCRMQRIRCEFDAAEPDICLTCKKANLKVSRIPCRRWKITDVRLFKPGQVQGFEWTQRWKDSAIIDDIGNWASSEVKTIRVTEGYTGSFVELKVRQFIPQEGDKLERTWVVNGQRRSVPIPPYAIIDLDAAKTAYENYIKMGLVECCKKLLGPREKLLWRTYALANKIMMDPSTGEEEKELIHSTLDLWMSIRLTTKSFEIVGEETLGMSRSIMDNSSPLRGSIPLPPVMGAQIDSILLHQTLPKLRRETLETLQNLTQKKQQKTWLTTYLVTFILLHNVALITKHDAGYAQKHGMKRRFAREDMVRQYHQGANTLLAYFHYCNKGVYPFSEECRDSDLQTLAELDETAIQFVQYTRTYSNEHKREWEDLWLGEEFENDYYFVSQLFEQNWQPRETV